jgi:AcrR family transcriptional regulator
MTLYRYFDSKEALIEEWVRGIVSDPVAAANALPSADPRSSARRLIHEHKQREHKRILKLCKEAGFPNPALSANLFYMLLEGAHSCVQCIGMRQVGEHLVQVVDLMVENSRRANGN